METKNNNLKDIVEQIKVKLERVEAYNNLITNFLENTIEEVNSSKEAPLIFCNYMKDATKDFLILDYTLEDTLKDVKEDLKKLDAELKKI